MESQNKLWKGIVLMLASALCVCFGQLFWKFSESTICMWLFLGFFFYIVGAMLMVLGYRFGKLSRLQPLLSSSYAISILLGFAFLGEPITVLKCVGVVVITAGVVLIASGGKE